MQRHEPVILHLKVLNLRNITGVQRFALTLRDDRCLYMLFFRSTAQLPLTERKSPRDDY